MGEACNTDGSTGFWLVNLAGINHLTGLDIDGRITTEISVEVIVCDVD